MQVTAEVDGLITAASCRAGIEQLVNLTDAGLPEEEVGCECTAGSQRSDMHLVLASQTLHLHHHVIVVDVETAAEVLTCQNPGSRSCVLQLAHRHHWIEALRNLDDPVVENPVALHFHVLAGRLVSTLLSVEVETEVETRLRHAVLRPGHTLHDVCRLVFVAQCVMIFKLLHPVFRHTFDGHVLSGAIRRVNATHEGQTFDGVLMLRVVVVVCHCLLVAVVEVVDVDVASVERACRSRTVPNQQVVHLVACHASLLVEGIIILCLTLIHLLHEQFCPRHQHLVVGAVVLLAELSHHSRTFSFGDVGWHHIIL